MPVQPLQDQSVCVTVVSSANMHQQLSITVEFHKYDVGVLGKKDLQLLSEPVAKKNWVKASAVSYGTVMQ